MLMWKTTVGENNWSLNITVHSKNSPFFSLSFWLFMFLKDVFSEKLCYGILIDWSQWVCRSLPPSMVRCVIKTHRKEIHDLMFHPGSFKYTIHFVCIIATCFRTLTPFCAPAKLLCHL